MKIWKKRDDDTWYELDEKDQDEQIGWGIFLVLIVLALGYEAYKWCVEKVQVVIAWFSDVFASVDDWFQGIFG